jgi:hypothetical protein
MSSFVTRSTISPITGPIDRLSAAQRSTGSGLQTVCRRSAICVAFALDLVERWPDRQVDRTIVLRDRRVQTFTASDGGRGLRVWREPQLACLRQPGTHSRGIRPAKPAGVALWRLTSSASAIEEARRHPEVATENAGLGHAGAGVEPHADRRRAPPSGVGAAAGQ